MKQSNIAQEKDKYKEIIQDILDNDVNIEEKFKELNSEYNNKKNFFNSEYNKNELQFRYDYTQSVSELQLDYVSMLVEFHKKDKTKIKEVIQHIPKDIQQKVLNDSYIKNTEEHSKLLKKAGFVNINTVSEYIKNFKSMRNTFIDTKINELTTTNIDLNNDKDIEEKFKKLNAWSKIESHDFKVKYNEAYMQMLQKIYDKDKAQIKKIIKFIPEEIKKVLKEQIASDKKLALFMEQAFIEEKKNEFKNIINNFKINNIYDEKKIEEDFEKLQKLHKSLKDDKNYDMTQLNSDYISMLVEVHKKDDSIIKKVIEYIPQDIDRELSYKYQLDNSYNKKNFQSMRGAFINSKIDKSITIIDAQFKNKNFDIDKDTKLVFLGLKFLIEAQSDPYKIESNKAYLKMLQKIYDKDKAQIKKIIKYIPQETKDFIYTEYDNLQNNKKVADFIFTEEKKNEFKKIMKDNRIYLDDHKDIKMQFQKLNQEYNKQKNEQKPCVTEGYVEMIKDYHPDFIRQCIQYIPEDVKERIMGEKIEKYEGTPHIHSMFFGKNATTGEKIAAGIATPTLLAFSLLVPLIGAVIAATFLIISGVIAMKNRKNKKNYEKNMEDKIIEKLEDMKKQEQEQHKVNLQINDLQPKVEYKQKSQKNNDQKKCSFVNADSTSSLELRVEHRTIN